MFNSIERNDLLTDMFLTGLRIYVGDENYRKIEMTGRMVLDDDYIKKCDYHFIGKSESLDCVVKDIYGTTSKHSMKTDFNNSIQKNIEKKTDVCYKFGEFMMKIRFYSRPHNGTYFTVDVLTPNGPTISGKKARKK